MLLCETGRAGHADAEDLAVFTGQLAALGVEARVSVETVPERPSRNLQFELAPRLVDGGLRPGDALVLLSADQLGDEALVRLRRRANGTEVAARAFGDFGKHQTALGVRARLAYVLGREPQLFNVAPTDPGAPRSAPAFGVPRVSAPAWAAPARPRPRLLLVGPDLDDPVQAAALRALEPRRGFATMVLTDGRRKAAWAKDFGRGIAFFQYGEILPHALGERTDLAILFAGTGSSYRLQCLIANLLVSGTPLLDGSPGHRLTARSDGFIAAPPGLVGLDGFLAADILPNLATIAGHVKASRAAAAAAAAPVLDFLAGEAAPAALPAPRRPAAARPAAGRIVFMPTNGVGLGHAQRCALIAAEITAAIPAAAAAPAFAAFPSCARLVKAHGFDVMPLVSRSVKHGQSHEHDLANYLRLRALTRGASALVFDGGYVFDSVYRTALEGDLASVWIRRGLWQEGQDNSVALDREKAFDRVIVPSEAFGELNAAYSRGEHLHTVGPVVQRVALEAEARAGLRERLAERYGRRFEHLVVSQLGSGVAADRSIQIQALCGLFERRSDTLHLILAWPNTTIEPGWFAWGNSRVVQTQRAGLLAAAADLVVTAAGYNSFHEVLYNRIPAIFVPQMGPYMDDQRARAQAAAARGLAVALEPTELVTLERQVVRHLDDGAAAETRSRLATAELPETGTAAAARLIEEIAYGDAAVERHPRADRSSRRR